MTAGDQVRSVDHTATVTAVTFDTDGTHVAVGDTDGVVTVSPVRGGDPTAIMPNGIVVTGLRFVPGGPLLVLTQAGSFAYDPGTGAPGPHAAVDAIVATLDAAGTALLAVGFQRSLALVDPIAGATTHTLSVDLDPDAVAWSPDGTAFAVGTEHWDEDDSAARGSVRIFDATTAAERARYVHDHTVHGLAFTPDGAGLVITSADGTVCLLDVVTGTPSWTNPFSDMTMAFALGPSGQWGAFGLADGTARVVRMSIGVEHHSVPLRSVPSGLIVSPDGHWLAAASNDGNLDVVELATGTSLFTFGFTGDIASGQDVPGLAFTPDSRLLGVAAGTSVLVLDTQ